MKMKIITTICIPLLLALTGCDSGSSSTPLKLPTADVKAAKPKADFVFSDADKQKMLLERKDIFSAVSLTFNGNEYNKLNFADEEAGNTIMQLKSSAGNTVVLMVPDGSNEKAMCTVYKKGSFLDHFSCANSKKSTNQQVVLIPSGKTTGGLDAQLEYNQEGFKYVQIIGSTKLTKTVAPSGEIEVKTSFVFEDYYQDFLCKGVCNERRHSTLGMTTYLQLKDILDIANGVKTTLIFDNNIGGSADDDINMYTGLMIRDKQLDTKVSKRGSVFSGGTDLFSAGIKRILVPNSTNIAIEKNQQIGVHSWSDEGKIALQIPYTDDAHRRQATYFNKMLGKDGVDFYLFTLRAAPPRGEHWMTKAEMEKYYFVTDYK